jgi:sulfite reductase (ferredoxin)
MHAKTSGLSTIGIKVLLGDFIRIKQELYELIKNYGANELRFSLAKNIVLRNIKEENLVLLSRISQIRFCYSWL